MEEKNPLSSLATRELAGLVSRYPWYAGARAEICRRTCGSDPAQYGSAAMYVYSRSLLYRMSVEAGDRTDDRSGLVSTLIKESPKARVHVAGGDFFSQDDYDAVASAGTAYNTPVIAHDDTATDPAADSPVDFCTETLASIYTEQGYFNEAEKIYCTLSLRYPEKSAYFAALIEQMNKQERN